MNKGIIRLEDLTFYAYHGCFDKEKVVGTNFSVNVLMEYDATKASQTDSIDDALNYQNVYDVIAKEMQQNSNLLEHLANRILDSLYMHFPQLLYAEVEVKKVAPPMGGEIGGVSVSLVR